MDCNVRSIESDLTARMWTREEIEIFEGYAKGNTNTRQDAETCLQEYSPRFKWSKKSRVLDIGSGDGGVTSILAQYIPKDCELIGSDVNENIIKYASQKTNGIKFMKFNVVEQLPEDMEGKFDHVFAMYLFHWIRDHETAFTNIYNILPKNGEFFATFLGYSDIYSVFDILSKRNKWAQWMKNIEQFLSPYYEYQDPDIHITKMLKKVGFKSVDVTCKQRFCIHDSIDIFKNLITGINPFDIPKNMWSEFLKDYVEVKRYMNLVDEEKGSVKTNYNLIVVHCVK